MSGRPRASNLVGGRGIKSNNEIKCVFYDLYLHIFSELCSLRQFNK